MRTDGSGYRWKPPGVTTDWMKAPGSIEAAHLCVTLPAVVSTLCCRLCTFRHGLYNVRAPTCVESILNPDSTLMLIVNTDIF